MIETLSSQLYESHAPTKEMLLLSQVDELDKKLVQCELMLAIYLERNNKNQELIRKIRKALLLASEALRQRREGPFIKIEAALAECRSLARRT